jgi:hypothetical protein
VLLRRTGRILLPDPAGAWPIITQPECQCRRRASELRRDVGPVSGRGPGRSRAKSGSSNLNRDRRDCPGPATQGMVTVLSVDATNWTQAVLASGESLEPDLDLRVSYRRPDSY